MGEKELPPEVIEGLVAMRECRERGHSSGKLSHLSCSRAEGLVAWYNCPNCGFYSRPPTREQMDNFYRMTQEQMTI
jgi:hypothetical protein